MPDNTSEKPVLRYHYAGLTHTGMVRDHNEDAYKLPEDTDALTLAKNGHLYVLADGMGGHQKGEVASTITTDTVSTEYYASIIQISNENPEHAIVEALANAIEVANEKVMDATQGGGTTIVAAVLYEDWLVSMNVGDSRAYLLRDNELYLLSRDHSLVSRLVEMGKITDEEALTHPRRNVLYQALGQGSEVEIHTVTEKLQLDDIIILCSDGLWGEVSDPAIKETLNNAGTPVEAAQKLIESANESGGADNITAIIIQVSEGTLDDNSYTTQTQLSADDTQPSILPRHEKPSDLPEGN